MDTGTYSDLLTRIKALAGVSDFTDNELTFLNSFVNRRANIAYRASEFWPRYLVVGEPRTVINNIVPYKQTGMKDIDTFLRIHKTYTPYQLLTAMELEYFVTNDGAYLVADTLPSNPTYVTYKTVWEGPYDPTSTNIPYEWFDYLAHSVYSDFLRQDGQSDKALTEDSFASDILSEQLSRTDITRSAGMIAHRISTHVSRSYRSPR